jgi:hypothetical protein
MSWVYLQNASERWIIVAAGLISLIGLNGLLLFLYRKAKAAKHLPQAKPG